MASLPLDSSDPPRSLAARLGVGAAMFLGFALYCEMHALIGWGAEPLIVSIRWALAATLAWGLLALAGWEWRHRLRAAAAGPLRSKALFLLAVAAPILLADLAAMELTSWFNEQSLLAHPLRRAYQFAPRALMLAGLLLLALALWERHLAPAPRPAVPAPAEAWLDFPEAPLLRLRAADVMQIRSAGNYSEILNGERNWLVRATLSDLADRLAPHGFVRIHRQTIVNMAALREICRDSAGRPVAHLVNGVTLPIGRRYLAALDALTLAEG